MRGWPKPRTEREHNIMLRMSRQGRDPSDSPETVERCERIGRIRANMLRRRKEEAEENEVMEVLREDGESVLRDSQRQRRSRTGSVDGDCQKTERMDSAATVLAQEEVVRASGVDSTAGLGNTMAEIRPSVELFVPALEQLDNSRPPFEHDSISLPPPLNFQTLTGRSPPPPDNFEEGGRRRTSEAFTEAELEDVLSTGEPAATIPGPVHSTRMEDIVDMGYGKRRPSVRPLSPLLHPCLDENARGRTLTRPVYTDPRMRGELEMSEKYRRDRAAKVVSSTAPLSNTEDDGVDGSSRTTVFLMDRGRASAIEIAAPRRPTSESFPLEHQPESSRPETEEFTSGLELEPEPMVVDDVVLEHIDPMVMDMEEVIEEAGG
jgi:hypothetical protein